MTLSKYLCILDSDTGLGNVGIISAESEQAARVLFCALTDSDAGRVHVYHAKSLGNQWVWDIGKCSAIADTLSQTEHANRPAAALLRTLHRCGVPRDALDRIDQHRAVDLLKAILARDGTLFRGTLRQDVQSTRVN